MNEIRKVARDYFDGGKEEEKQLTRKFFQSLDANADGKVSLNEYRKHVNPYFSSEHVFRQLDENGDGTLDFDEALVLYYMDNVSIPRCSACHDMLLSSYFSCLACLGKTSYYLCCDCYSVGKFKHQHSSHEFADTRALLKLLDRLMGKVEVTTIQSDIADKEVHKDDADGKANFERSSSSSTRSTAKTIVKTLAIGVGRTIIIKGVGAAAVASGCCIM